MLESLCQNLRPEKCMAKGKDFVRNSPFNDTFGK